MTPTEIFGICAKGKTLYITAFVERTASRFLGLEEGLPISYDVWKTHEHFPILESYAIWGEVSFGVDKEFENEKS